MHPPTPLKLSPVILLSATLLSSLSACTGPGSGPLTYGGDDRQDCDNGWKDLVTQIVSTLDHNHHSDDAQFQDRPPRTDDNKPRQTRRPTTNPTEPVPSAVPNSTHALT